MAAGASAAPFVASGNAAPAPRPRRLPIAHAVWWIVIAVDALFFIVGVPGLYVALHQPCTDASIECSTVQAPLADFQVMLQHGQVEASAIFVLTVVVLVSLVFFAVGGLIAWRKWHDPMGLFVSAVLITFGATGISDALQVPAVPPLDVLNPILEPLSTVLTLLQYPALATFLLTFPSGRFAPRWSWLLILLWVGQLFVFFAGAPDGVLFVAVVTTWGSTIAVQVYRYIRVYSPLERQQTKWVVFSLAVVSVPSQIIDALLPIIWPELNTPGSLFRLTAVLSLALFWLPISLGVGIAILRSRLYDIDLLINRALVYGSLTVILAIVYTIGVVGSQTVVSGLTHASDEGQSPLIIVITTLVIAALFQPLRRRIQAFIDQRFYRTKYDAARTLAAFATTLREEVDLTIWPITCSAPSTRRCSLPRSRSGCVRLTAHPDHALIRPLLRLAEEMRMSRQDISLSPVATSHAGTESPSSETHLHGWRLVAARGLVGTAMAVVAVVFALALPGSFDRLGTPCNDPVNQCLIRPEQVAPLADLGITPQALAIVAVVISCLIVLVVDAVAALLVWRRSDDWMALLVALVFILLPVDFTPVLEVLTYIPGDWQVAIALLGEASSVSLFLLIALFPSGRFVPRWLWLPFLLLQIFFSPLGDIPIPGPDVPEVFFFIFILALLLCFVISLIYRYRRVSTPMQRQQTKWVIYGFILLIVLNQLFWQTYLQVPAFQEKDSLYGLLAFPDDFLALAILLAALGVSVLRYRLYDIDIIINQTLVYGLLTAILATVYAIGVIGSQTIVGGLTHASDEGQSPLIIVVTTLVIAALFQPLRRRIQAFIDRRFYRRKYDAEKTLAAFGATLRQEVDLGQLREHLVAVVEETTQPAHISLWLRSPDHA